MAKYTGISIHFKSELFSTSILPTYLLPVLFDLLAVRAALSLLGTSRPDDWLAASMADFTSPLQVFLSLGSDCEIPHEEQLFFRS